MKRIREPMMDPIRRGTTPTITFDTPYPAEIITDGWVTFSQRGEVILDKRFSDEAVEVYDNKVMVTLTQEETLGLTSADVASAQIRFAFNYGKAGSSGVYKIPVLDILKGGLI